MRFIFLIALYVYTLPGYAQDYQTLEQVPGKVKKWYEEALNFNKTGQYAEAIGSLDKALDKAPDFIDAILLQADLQLLLGRAEKAEAGFERALSLAPDYNRLTYKLLGMAEMDAEKYTEAISHLQTYLDFERLREKDRQEVEKLLENARFAAEAVASPVPFKPESMGDSINTDQPEYLPSLSAEGEVLVYTTRVDNRNEDLFMSEKVDGVWRKGRPLDQLNTPYNESRPSLSADGKLMVFVRESRQRNFDLYYSERGSRGWSEPKPLGPPVNSASWESQPSLSADGRELYFASDRPGGEGKLDIWVSYRQPDGSWGGPQNPGPIINTTENEQAPFIHPDGQTLYFMSRGHPGMGKYDLFLSRRQSDGSWGEAHNLGYPINTANNEGALFVSLDGKTAYFDSDKYGPGGLLTDMGNADLFRFELHEEARPQPATYVKATVIDARNGRTLDARVEFVALDDSRLFAAANTGRNGSFLVCLPAGRDYGLNVSKKGYLFYSENFALTDTSRVNDPYLLKIALRPVPESAPEIETSPTGPIILRNVFFETGSARLKPESVNELSRLRELLKENPSLRVRINGHTDDVGSEADNLALSENRAKAVYQWLIDNGITSERLSYKGYGETRPVATNEVENGKQKNRRVEFEVME